jgi:predicted acetyltransferase
VRIEQQFANRLSEALRRDLKRRVDREFGNVPIVQNHEWSEPTWALLGFEGEQLVSFLNIVDRTVQADAESVHVFGLNNVITEPEFRGRGYSKGLNQAALAFMRQTDPHACGFLFCADDLIAFYERLGWKVFGGQVIVSQPTGDKKWTSNAMYYDLLGQRDWQQIHLCGLPW